MAKQEAALQVLCHTLAYIIADVMLHSSRCYHQENALPTGHEPCWLE
jgi:hypothetical protein